MTQSCPLCKSDAVEPMGEGSALLVCKSCAYVFVVDESWERLKKAKEDEE